MDIGNRGDQKLFPGVAEQAAGRTVGVQDAVLTRIGDEHGVARVLEQLLEWSVCMGRAEHD
jgi:hypothetical protein